MLFCILTYKPRSYFVLEVSRSLKKAGHYVKIVNLRDIVMLLNNSKIKLFDNKSKVNLFSFDGVLARPLGKINLMHFSFAMNVLFSLKSNGITVVNDPLAYVFGSNKLTEYVLLSSSGIKVPLSVVSSSHKLNPFELIPQEKIIMKPICGSRGIGVEELKKGIKFYFDEDKIPIFQKFVRGSNYDLRLLVVNGKVIASMKRVSDSFKTNVSSGATPVKYEPPEYIKEIAIKAANVIKANIAGVDIAVDKDETPYVLEVNTQPDFIGLQLVSKVSIPDEIAKGFIEVVKR